MGGSSLPPFLPGDSGAQEVWEEQLPLKTEAKNIVEYVTISLEKIAVTHKASENEASGRSRQVHTK